MMGIGEKATASGPAEVEAQSPPLPNCDADVIKKLGYTRELRPNRSMFTLLFQSLAIAAVRLPVKTDPRAAVAAAG